MKLLELLQKTSWNNVKQCLLEVYPDSDSSLYEKHFLQLRYLKPQLTKMRIVLEVVTAKNEDDETYVDVYGQDGTKHQELEDFKWYSEQARTEIGTQEVKYALDFTSWEEWLEMVIEPNTLLEFSDAQVIAHCLWEMTFHGFEQHKIQTQIEELRFQSEAFKNMTPAELAENCGTLEDFIQELRSNTDL
jgi:hypothetical protein